MLHVILLHVDCQADPLSSPAVGEDLCGGGPLEGWAAPAIVQAHKVLLGNLIANRDQHPERHHAIVPSVDWQDPRRWPRRPGERSGEKPAAGEPDLRRDAHLHFGDAVDQV